MTRKLLMLFFLVIFSFGVYGQDSLAYKSKWQIRTLGGANIPLTTLTQGTALDYLLLYDDHSYNWQILSLSYFFSKHWGVEANIQASSSNKIADRPHNFFESMKLEYGDKYFVHSFNSDYNYTENILIGSITKSYIGAVYRLETSRFYVYPKFAIGMISLSTDKNSVKLKELNSNNEYGISFSSEKSTNHYFTLAPSVSFGYKISKRFYLNADIMFSYYKTNIVFEKEFTNLYTNEKTVEYFDYKRGISTLSLGAGLIFVMH